MDLRYAWYGKNMSTTTIRDSSKPSCKLFWAYVIQKTAQQLEIRFKMKTIIRK
jgi:hypothetical protein